MPVDLTVCLKVVAAALGMEGYFSVKDSTAMSTVLEAFAAVVSQPVTALR